MKTTVLIITIVLAYCSTAQVDPWTITTLDTVWFEHAHVDTGSTSPPPTASGDTTIPKLVYWVHGIAGNSHSWNRVQTSTEDQAGNPVPGYPVRRTDGLTVDYSGKENLRILALGGYVNNELIEPWRVVVPRRDTLPVNKNFVIAHSQGGIVSRAMRHNNLRDDASYPFQFGALATFNSPHGGANIINTTRPDTGDVQRWINKGCKALLSAEVQTIVSSKWWIDVLVSPDAVQSFSSDACDGLNRTVLPILVNAIRKPVGQDYAVGASNLATLDSTAQLDSMKVVTFYGVEEDPVLWRVLHSMTYTKDTSLSGQILFNNPFGLNDDDEMPAYIMHLINVYYGYYDLYTMLDAMYWFDSYGEKAKIYRDAGWWLSGANMWWKRFIGTRYDSAYADGYLCFCNNAVIPNWVSDPSYCVDENENPCNAVEHWSHIVLEEPSDGVVPLSSQIDYPGAKPVKMEDTNHMQARNCEETKDRLNELFDGKHGERFILYRK